MSSILRILFATSEVYPLIKTGGLADVSGALPNALTKLGADVRILVPGYQGLIDKLENPQKVCDLPHIPGGGTANIIQGLLPGTQVPVLAIQHALLYEREGGPYSDTTHKDWPDNPLRFGVLSYIAAMLSSGQSPWQDWIPDILHCNDWQTGLAPAYLDFFAAKSPQLYCAKSVLSIHNMAFQGCYPESWLPTLWISKQSYQMNGLEYYGQLSFLKAGTYYADYLSTVSPTYAREIQTPQFGFGLEGLMSSRRAQLYGILNGLDTEEWNPETDTHLPTNYSTDSLENKKAVKRGLQQRFGLPQADVPMFGAVSRLTYQKGLDLLLQIAPKFLKEGCQIVILGGGEKDLEDGFNALARMYPTQVAVTVGYNEPLSHNIMAGCDIFVMPSRFEPCGLNQMYGLRYGTPPIVNNTGGLADSVTNTDDHTLAIGTANGFVIEHASTEALENGMRRALHYFKQTDIWKTIQMNGMRKPLGWEISAQKYLNLYNNLLK